MSTFCCRQKYCNFTHENKSMVMNHIWLSHSQQYHFRAICFISNCQNEFKTYERFRNHIMYSRHEGDEPDSTKFMCDIPNCCSKLNDLKELKSHYIDHLDKKNCPLPLECVFQNCRNSYKYNEKIATRNHFTKYHRDDTELELRKNFYVNNNNNTNELFLIDEANDEDFTLPEFNYEQQNLSEFVLKSYSLFDVEEYYMKMYLKLHSKLIIPESSCEEILSSFSFLININNQDINETINQMSKQYNSSSSLEPIYNNYISRHALVKQVQDNFKTKDARNKWIRGHKYYVAPIELKLEHYNESNDLDLHREHIFIGSEDQSELDEIEETREEVFSKYEYVLKGKNPNIVK